MAKIKNRIASMSDALRTLEGSIALYHEHQAIYTAHPTSKNEEVALLMRDGMIQRFEYCIDTLWKVLKDYLEHIEKIDVPNSSPRGVVRDAITTGLLEESEGKDCMDMVESRNRTSHIYHADMAEDIASRIPRYYLLMKKIVDRMQVGISKD